MHIHILGICGTFMGGLAILAREGGHTVTGCDSAVYPPMSTQLEAAGIRLTEGYGAEQIDLAPDLWVVGNVVSRGNPLMEAILDRGLPYTSGPQWIGEHILHEKWVLAVAGTHGKTTTSAMLAWILEDAGYAPGFLIGGVPQNFGISARLTDSTFFVIEADEYDTAFFDKRSKFVHYHTRTAILNNLEFDHADIFVDLNAIETQFHHLVRTVPSTGQLIYKALEPALERVLARGSWSSLQAFGDVTGWHWRASGQTHVLVHGTAEHGALQWDLLGAHNRMNALAAICAARHVGVAPELSLAALSRFASVKRRMEVRGSVRGITVYDDFAHHPSAIQTTIDGLVAAMAKQDHAGRILAVLEPRSNTMKLGVMKDALAQSLAHADLVYGYGPTAGRSALGWDLDAALSPLGAQAHAYTDLDALVAAVVADAQHGDQVLVMSNGSFGGVHEKILQALAQPITSRDRP